MDKLRKKSKNSNISNRGPNLGPQDLIPTLNLCAKGGRFLYWCQRQTLSESTPVGFTKPRKRRRTDEDIAKEKRRRTDAQRLFVLAMRRRRRGARDRARSRLALLWTRTTLMSTDCSWQALLTSSPSTAVEVPRIVLCEVSCGGSRKTDATWSRNEWVLLCWTKRTLSETSRLWQSTCKDYLLTEMPSSRNHEVTLLFRDARRAKAYSSDISDICIIHTKVKGVPMLAATVYVPPQASQDKVEVFLSTIDYGDTQAYQGSFFLHG